MPSIENIRPYKNYNETKADLKILGDLILKISERSKGLSTYQTSALKSLFGNKGIYGFCGLIQAAVAKLDEYFIISFNNNQPSKIQNNKSTATPVQKGQK